MPRITALQPDGVVGVSLDHFGWKIGLATTLWGETPCLCLSWWYETPTPYLSSHAGPVDITPNMRVSLLKCPAPVAEAVQALEPIVRGARSGGSLADDTRRMTEAFTLFKNMKVKQEVIDSSVADAAKLLAAYWELRAWLATGCVDKFKHEALNTTLIGTP